MVFAHNLMCTHTATALKNKLKVFTSKPTILTPTFKTPCTSLPVPTILSCFLFSSILRACKIIDREVYQSRHRLALTAGGRDVRGSVQALRTNGRSARERYLSMDISLYTLLLHG
ncbi:hypothetical protein E1B28_011995 [Marasmius oreades]|uniref:Uncharacterized protein n=1 Tax=Marasmius oreades TaxID=181124 RepID=A0A9P7RQN8_9AGAR|nr:uncharacterized protein E1B28_011995 [Marasmius oreades]KAG7087954.1 hypothetical protein E1B28_011995 [Marasmius oreades]